MKTAKETTVHACPICGTPLRCASTPVEYCTHEGEPFQGANMPRSKAIKLLRDAIEETQSEVSRLQGYHQDYTGKKYETPNM